MGSHVFDKVELGNRADITKLNSNWVKLSGILDEMIQINGNSGGANFVSSDDNVVSGVSINGNTYTFMAKQKESIESLRFNEDFVTINNGEEIKLDVALTPTTSSRTDLMWESSDNFIATVDDGVIKPHKIGGCLIKATAPNGKYAICVVNVESLWASAKIEPSTSFDTTMWGTTCKYVAETTNDVSVEISTQATEYAGYRINIRGDKVVSLRRRILEFGYDSIYLPSGVGANEVKMTVSKYDLLNVESDLFEIVGGLGRTRFATLIDDDTSRINFEFLLDNKTVKNSKTLINGLYIRDITEQFPRIIQQELLKNNKNTLYNYIDVKKQEGIVRGFSDMSDSIIFLQSSDYHLPINGTFSDGYHCQVDATVMTTNILPLDFTCIGGDIGNVEEATSKSQYLNSIKYISDAFSSCPKTVCYAKGNHEVMPYINNDWATVPTNAEIFDNLIGKTNVVGGTIVYDESFPKNGYYYVDFPIKKHRVIVINTAERSIDGNGDTNNCHLGVTSNHQFVWIRDFAMNMTGKTDWTVSIHGHDSLATRGWNHYYGSERRYMHELFDAFKRGGKGSMVAYSGIQNQTWDFTNQGEINLIGYFHGHVHDDCIGKIYDVNYFGNTSGRSVQRTTWSSDTSPVKLPPIRSLVGKNSMSQNVYVYNKNNNKLYIIKLGSGMNQAIDIYSKGVV